MAWFAASKITKLEQNRDLDGLIPFLYEKVPEVAKQARDAFLSTAKRAKKPSEKAIKILRQLANSKNEAVRGKAWEALLAGGDERWLQDVVTILEATSSGPLAQAAFGYFDTLRSKDPDHLRASLSANEQIHEIILKDLDGEIHLSDGKVQRAYRFVELFDLWDQGEVAAKTLTLIETSEVAPRDHEFYEMLMDAMVRKFPVRMAEKFLVYWEESRGSEEFDERMVERIKGIGKKAIPTLRNYFTEWRKTIAGERQEASDRRAPYHLAYWMIFLIGELGLKEDQELLDWMFEVAIDTKLAESGRHRKNAREATEKIKKREKTNAA